MATLPAGETLSRAAAQSADRGTAPVAGLEMAVAAAAILLWIVLDKLREAADADEPISGPGRAHSC